MENQGEGPRRWTLDDLITDPLIGRVEVLEPNEALFKSRGRWAKNVAHPNEVEFWSPVRDIAKTTGVSIHKLYRYVNKDCLPAILIDRCGHSPSFRKLIPSDPDLIAKAESKADDRAWGWIQRKNHRDPEYRKPKPEGNWCASRPRPGKGGQR